ncbi:uncharacterized protein LOC129588014 [Paramacrobiotus metropolitanus]|uniref:uncharacterized protein LOC129588014 n=1 Tax=Paramacrobiotus metropolitanus TaxID=2943436 RepID=UPI00244640FA|nr:uncharacterized protein LOC129588014 [Paramacrobiotus metropolitanus]
MALCWEYRATQSLLHSGQTHDSRNKHTISHHILLWGTVAVYLVTNGPNLLASGIVLVQIFGLPITPTHTISDILPLICDVSLMANYSLNFFVYLTVSKEYRQQVRQLLAMRCEKVVSQCTKRSAKPIVSHSTATTAAVGGARSAHVQARTTGMHP